MQYNVILSLLIGRLVMMLPVAKAVLESISMTDILESKSTRMHLLSPNRVLEEKASSSRAFSTAIYLAVAYSSSIGGLATLTGTGTNLVFAAQVCGPCEKKKKQKKIMTLYFFSLEIYFLNMVRCLSHR